MKRLLFAALCATLIMPLYSQETEWVEEGPGETREGAWELIQKPPQKKAKEKKIKEKRPKKPFTFARDYIEFGFDLGVGFDNDLINWNDIFIDNLVIDLEKLGGDVRKAGLNLNMGLLSGFYITTKDIEIGSGLWNLGIFSCLDGELHFNAPKSLVALLTEGNIKQHSSKGTISASGGIFANVGVGLSAKYEKFRFGVKPAAFTPLVFIPKSGIKWNLETEEKIVLNTSGEIAVYGLLVDYLEKKSCDLQIPYGFDISLEGEYDLFPHLGIGASLSRIPLVPAVMESRNLIAMDDFNLDISGEDLMAEEDLDLPKFKYDISYQSADYNVFRPLRFDIYAHWRPFGEFFVVRPNLGFSVGISDKQWYFTAGADARLYLLKNLFLFHLGTGIEENVWKQRLGFALNLRALELGVETIFRSQRFTGSFTGQGFGLNLGLRFGW